MPEYQSIVGIDLWTALFAFCNMLITFAILKKFFFKPVKKMIDDRQQEIDGMYKNAADSKAQAQALQQEYTAKLKDANAEGERILKAAAKKAQDREETIIRDAQAQAAKTLERAQEQIQLEQRQAMNDMKDQVSGIALDIASAVLKEDIDSKKHKKLIDSFIQQLGEPS